MSKKVVCSIYLDEEVKIKAHRAGINISKATENILRILLGQLSNIDLSSVKLEDVKEPKKEEAKQVAEEVY